MRISSFKKPTKEELEHDFLWRVRKALPTKGIIGVFDRSHYEDTQAEAHARRLFEQLRGVRALLELFGEWGDGLRLGAFALPRCAGRVPRLPCPVRSIQGSLAYFRGCPENSSSFRLR